MKETDKTSIDITMENLKCYWKKGQIKNSIFDITATRWAL